MTIDIDRTRERLLSGKMTRREVHRALAAFGIGFASLMLAPRPLRAAQSPPEGFMYFTWTGFTEEGLHPGWFETYETLPSTFWADQEEGFQKMRAGFKPTVSHPTTDSVPRWRNADIIQPIDTSRLKDWSKIFDRLRSIEDINFDGNTWMVPYEWGNDSILFRTDLVDEKYVEDPTWQIVVDERYNRRIAMYDDVLPAIGISSLVAGNGHHMPMSEEELAKTRTALKKINDNVRFWWGSPTEAEQGLASGELVAVYAWNESLVHLRDQGLPVKYMNPREGILNWVGGCVIGKDVEGDLLDAAYLLINDYLSVASGRYLIETFGYGHANRETFDLVDQQKLADLGMDSPNRLFDRGHFYRNVDDRMMRRYIDMFEEVKAGL